MKQYESGVDIGVFPWGGGGGGGGCRALRGCNFTPGRPRDVWQGSGGLEC